MKRKKLTSIMGVAIAVMMCISLLPTTALATEGDFTIENGVLVKYNYNVKYYDNLDPADSAPSGDDGSSIPSVSVGDGAEPYVPEKPPLVRLKVVIPDGVTSIGQVAFMQNNAIEEVVIPEGVTSIGHAAFADCPFLKRVTLPDSLTSIGDLAFRNCPQLTNITLGSKLTSIADGAFASTGITSITIPDSVTELAGSTFNHCENLTSVTLPKGLTVLHNDMFWNCPALTSVNIPASVTNIEMGAFAGCTSLSNITLPEGLTTIGIRTFMDCTSLTSITIPKSVTSIGHETFYEYVEGPYGVPDTIIPLPNLTIKGVAGSYAETFAKEEGHPFVAINGTTTPADTTTPATTDKPSSWAETQVNTAIAANIVPAALQGQYTQATTRAEFCALAVALYENVKGTEITERQTFSDTTDINVEKAAAIGVVSGIGDNKFSPNDTLTREQAATMLSRLAAAIGRPLTEQDATFADNGSISTWAAGAVGQAQASGVMGGVGNNTFEPQGEYTREQSIVTITRLYDLVK